MKKKGKMAACLILLVLLLAVLVVLTKKNSTAEAGCKLFLTKPLGIWCRRRKSG